MFYGARSSTLSNCCLLEPMSIYSVSSYVHKVLTNSDCVWYDPNNMVDSSCRVKCSLQYFVNCVLPDVFRIIVASIESDNLSNPAVFFGFGGLHVEHEYFHTPCTHVRLELHIIQEYDFFPCSHPPVQDTHRRLNSWCLHNRCGLHFLQFDLHL